METLDNMEIIRIPYSLLIVTGSVPVEKYTIGYILKCVLIYVAQFIWMATMILECYNVRSNFVKFSEVLYVSVNGVAFILKYTYFITIGRTALARVIKMLQNDMTVTHPHKQKGAILKDISTIQNVSRIYQFLALLYVIIVAVFPVFIDQNLPFPFSYDLGWFLPFMYAFQVLTVLSAVCVCTSLDLLCSALMHGAAIHLDILTNKLISIRESYDDDCDDMDISDAVVVSRLKECIVHHQTIIKFVECIDAIYGFCALSQFVASAIVICVTLFNAAVLNSSIVQTGLMIVYLNIAFTQLFIYCWFGNVLQLKSIGVRDACYTFNWYDCGASVRSNLLIIMARSQRPLQVTAYKFSTLSLSAFTAIMRWSYSYFTLLNKLYEQYSERHGGLE